MTNSSAVNAAKSFLKTVWDGDPPSDSVLIAALDRLLVGYHETPPTKFLGTELEPPRRDWRIDYKESGKRFPDFGYYALVDPLEVEKPSGILLGDACDDIADISTEMRYTVWYADNVDNATANWHFRLMYLHWGEHARELSRYLFARLSR